MVAIGGMSVEAEEAMLRLFDEEELLVDLFLPTRLYPFDCGILEDSLAMTRKLLVIEEGQGFVSLSSEILAQVAERFGDLNVRCRRLTAESCPIPSSRPLEEQCLPNTGSIVRKASEFVRELVH
jgi:pyruvate/2-oxoglutarate/acetoin dehydrogenase E1 component